MIEGEIISQGVYQGMTNDKYRSAFGVSQSELKVILDQSPAHLKARQAEPEEDRTKALVFGELFHNLILNRNCRFYVKPLGLNFVTKEGKAWKEKHCDAPIITAEENDALDKMIYNCRNHEVVKELLTAFDSEVSFFYDDKVSGEKVKGRVDLVPRFGNCLVDFKTTICSKPEVFANQFTKLGYHIQSAFYPDYWNLVNPKDIKREYFLIVAVEKTEPYPVVVYKILGEALEVGRAEYQKALSIYSDCRKSGNWYSYSNKIEELTLPAWKIKQFNQEYSLIEE